MAKAGYSGNPLWKKLGIKPDSQILLINPPADYTFLLETDISNQLVTGKQTPDIVHLFIKNNKEFEAAMKKLAVLQIKNPAISIWVSWYKKSSGISTDVTEDTIRRYALSNNLVDIKVCAVSEIWSGLKLVVPLAKRL